MTKTTTTTTRPTTLQTFNYLMSGGKEERKSNVFFSLLEKKKGFLLLTFSNLITQLGITYYVMMNYSETFLYDPKTKNPTAYFYLLFFIQLSLVLLLTLFQMPTIAKFIIFSIFSASLGLSLSYIKYITDPQLIQTAIIGTISIFALMFIFGVSLILFGVKLRFRFGMFLFFAILLLIVANIVSLFMKAGSAMYKGFAFFGIILFSLYILYDTNHILQRDYRGDFITASMDYYLDIINLFLSLEQQ